MVLSLSVDCGIRFHAVKQMFLFVIFVAYLENSVYLAAYIFV